MYFAVAVVLFEVDGPFEALDSDLFAIGEVNSVVDAGSHSLAYLFYGFERRVEAQLHDEFSP